MKNSGTADLALMGGKIPSYNFKIRRFDFVIFIE